MGEGHFYVLRWPKVAWLNYVSSKVIMGVICTCESRLCFELAFSPVSTQQVGQVAHQVPTFEIGGTIISRLRRQDLSHDSPPYVTLSGTAELAAPLCDFIWNCGIGCTPM